MLIAYTEALDPGAAHKSLLLERATPDQWFAFTLDPAGKVQLRHLGAIDALTGQARAWYVGLRNPKSDPAQLRRDGEQLRRAVLDPLLAGTRAQRLFVVPDGELFRVSFAALPSARGYLVESGTRVHTLAKQA